MISGRKVIHIEKIKAQILTKPINFSSNFESKMDEF